MKAHCAIIEAGPASARRLCCGTTKAPVAAAEMAQAAMDAIDDAVALMEDRPVPTRSLLRTVLRSLTDERHHSMVVIHPSWWSAARVDVIRSAATSLADDVVTRRRSELLVHAAPSRSMTVIVEIADRFVVITGAAVTAERRDGEPQSVAERVTRVVAGLTAGTTGTVLIDAPTAITGAAALATIIADQLRVANADLTVIDIDEAALFSLATTVFSVEDEADVPDAAESAPGKTSRGRHKFLLPSTAVVLAAAMLGAGLLDHRPVPVFDVAATTSLVEGRIALTIPANWSARRVVDGPGSARVQVTSPADPETALHVTQSAVADQTLSDTAESLKRAIDAEPSGVFVDFNPFAHSGGRPAVTYREVRAGHDIRWSVLLDGAVRISIGCQSPTGGEEAVREVCELAVRSARALR